MPKVFSDPRNWQLDADHLSVAINDFSDALAERFGSGTYYFGLSAQGMLEHVAREFSCNPVEVAVRACERKD